MWIYLIIVCVCIYKFELLKVKNNEVDIMIFSFFGEIKNFG